MATSIPLFAGSLTLLYAGNQTLGDVALAAASKSDDMVKVLSWNVQMTNFDSPPTGFAGSAGES